MNYNPLGMQQIERINKKAIDRKINKIQELININIWRLRCHPDNSCNQSKHYPHEHTKYCNTAPQELILDIIQRW